MTTKTFCDVCEEEIEGERLVVSFSLESYPEERCFWDTHPECRHGTLPKIQGVIEAYEP